MQMYGCILCLAFGRYVFIHQFVARLAIIKGMEFYIAETEKNNWTPRQLT